MKTRWSNNVGILCCGDMLRQYFVDRLASAAPMTNSILESNDMSLNRDRCRVIFLNVIFLFNYGGPHRALIVVLSQTSFPEMPLVHARTGKVSGNIHGIGAK